MAEDKYYCREPHREDLTDRVKAALKGKGVLVVKRFSLGEPAARPRRIVVKCSQNHENVFVIQP